MVRSRWFSVLGILPLTFALAGLAGCEKPQGDEDSTEAAPAKIEAANDAEGQNGRPEKFGGHFGAKGPAMLFRVALHKLDLSDAQKTTIEGLVKDLQTGRDKGEEDHAANRAALAKAIRSGSVDEAALIAQMKDNAPKPDTARFATAMQTLHDTLTAEQRAKLVAEMQSGMGKAEGKHGRRGPGRNDDGDHDRAGKPEGARGKDHAHGPRNEMGRMAGPMGHMLRGLDLSEEQRTKVRDAFEKIAPKAEDREAMKAKHEAFRKEMGERLSSFASDKFDAAAFAKPNEEMMQRGPQEMATHMVKTLSVIVPILNETQRAELAKRIEEGPKAMMGRGHGKMHHAEEQE